MEYKKILLNRNVLLPIFVLCMINLIFFYVDMTGGASLFSHLMEKKYCHMYINMQDAFSEKEEYLAFLQEKCNVWYYGKDIQPEEEASARAAYFLMDQVNYGEEYSTFLDNVCTQADEMLTRPFFQENHFSRKNIIRTKQDYEKLKAIPIVPVNGKAITGILSYGMTDYFLLIAMGIVLLEMFRERRDGSWKMVRGSRNGRERLAVQRVMILGMTAAGLTAVFYGSLFAMSGAVNGFEWNCLSDFVQSIPEFQRFVIPMKIETFLMWVLLWRSLVLFLAALLIWAVSVWLQEKKLICFAFGALLVEQYSTYYWIKAGSSVQFFKYVNLFYFLDLESWCTKYQNFPVFGSVVNTLTAAWAGIAILILIVIPLCIVESRIHYPKTESRVWGIPFRQYSTSLTIHEWKKIFWDQKGILIFALYIILLFYVKGEDLELYRSLKDVLTDQYYEMWEGELTEVTFSEMEEEEKRLAAEMEQLREEYKAGTIDKGAYEMRVGYMEVQMKGFDEICNQAVYAQERGSQYLVYPRGYENLFTETRMLNVFSLLTLVILAIFTAPAGSFENQYRMKELSHCTRKGGSVQWRQKVFICIMGAVCMSMLSQIFLYQYVKNRYAMRLWDAPAASLPFMSGIPFEGSIFAFWIVLCIARAVLLAGMSCLFLFLASRCRTIAIAYAAVLFVAVIPSVFYVIGFDLFRYVSILWYTGISGPLFG